MTEPTAEPEPAPGMVRAATRLARAVPWQSFVLVLLAAVVLASLYGGDVVRPKRRWQEAIGVAVTAAFTLSALILWRRSRAPFHLWGAALLGVLLCREIHFAGSGTGVYPGLVLLLAIALRAWSSVGSVLERARVMLPMAAGFLAYAVAVAADQRWLKSVPGEDLFHVPLEESMEILGHLLIGAAVLLSARIVRSSGGEGESEGSDAVEP